MTHETDWDIPARDLLIEARAFRAGTLCRDVRDYLRRDEDIPAVAVVDDGGEVIGLIGRARFLALMPAPGMVDSYPRRPIEAVADPAPLVVDIEESVDKISAMIAQDHAQALVDGFAISEAGRFAGLGRTGDLLAISVAQGRRRNGVLAAARQHAEEAERLRGSFQHLETLFADLLARMEPPAPKTRRRSAVMRRVMTLHETASALAKPVIRQSPHA